MQVASPPAGPRDAPPGPAPSPVLPDLEEASPAEVVAWALGRFEPGRVAVVTALQRAGMVVVDLAMRLDPAVRIVTIDTGRLPTETLAYLDVVRAHYGRDLEVRRPDPAHVVDLVTANGPDGFYGSPERRLECCHVRKVAPASVLLGELDCWLTGLRRAQSGARAGTPVVEWDPAHPGTLKVNPVAALTRTQVDGYLAEHDVPIHPLYAAGYQSIGCAPCTRAVRPGDDPRAGRWWWERGVDSECGLHGPASGSAATIRGDQG